MKFLLYIITIFSQAIFFSYNGITGNIYLGRESSNTFISFILSLDIVSIVIAIWGIIKSHKLESKGIISLLMLFFILFISMIEHNQRNAFLINNFIAFSLPCFFIAMDLSYNKSLHKMAKWFDVLMLFISIVSCISLFSGQVIIGGETYQALSYYSAFAFSINLLMIFLGNNFDRFYFTKLYIYKILSIILLGIQVATTLMSGGRGGFILIVASLLLISYIKYKLIIKHHKRRFIFAICLVPIICVCILYFLPENIIMSIERGSNRTFSYITGTGIDMGQTSGRDILYNNVLHYIDDSPIYGYGLFKYIDIVGFYPHNFFLEILLQGGVILFSLCMSFVISIIVKYKKVSQNDNTLLIFIPILLYAYVMLMFSGSYMSTGFLWFFNIYIFIYRK